jgi:predicted DNA-binding transcriptional regulator AlpA
MKRYRVQNIEAAKNDEALLTIETVSTLVGYAPNTIRKHVRAGTFPAPVDMGTNMRLWKARDVRVWLEKKTGPEGPVVGEVAVT